MLQTILGTLLIISGIVDSYKYIWQAQKIRKVKTARGHSRKFINVAIMNDVIRIGYGITINDWYITGIGIFAAITMGYLFWTIYLYYPYRGRGLINFKRPNLGLYIINSIVPNSIRKKL